MSELVLMTIAQRLDPLTNCSRFIGSQRSFGYGFPVNEEIPIDLLVFESHACPIMMREKLLNQLKDHWEKNPSSRKKFYYYVVMRLRDKNVATFLGSLRRKNHSYLLNYEVVDFREISEDLQIL